MSAKQCIIYSEILRIFLDYCAVIWSMSRKVLGQLRHHSQTDNFAKSLLAFFREFFRGKYWSVRPETYTPALYTLSELEIL